MADDGKDDSKQMGVGHRGEGEDDGFWVDERSMRLGFDEDADAGLVVRTLMDWEECECMPVAQNLVKLQA